MARLKRLAVGGAPHLATLSARGPEAAIVDDADARAFVDALREAAAQHRCAVHAYALAPGEVWLLLTPAQPEALGLTMQALGRRYVARLNRRHGRRGSPWAGRFGATPCLSDGAVLEAMTFLAARARQAPELGEASSGDAGSPGGAGAEWASLPHHLGRQRIVWLQDPPGWWALGNTPFEREARFAGLSECGLAPARAAAWADAARHGWVVSGGVSARDAAAAQAAGRPLRPRAAGRPRRKAEVGAAAASPSPGSDPD